MMSRACCLGRQSTCFSVPVTLPPGFGPSHHGTTFSADAFAPSLILASALCNSATAFDLQFLDFARLLFGVAAALGVFIIQPMLLDRHARLRASRRGPWDRSRPVRRCATPSPHRRSYARARLASASAFQ